MKILNKYMEDSNNIIQSISIQIVKKKEKSRLFTSSIGNVVCNVLHFFQIFRKKDSI